jgi:hypothetical protein
VRSKGNLEDCASRIHGRVQVTTAGHRAYLEAVESGFGMDVDNAQLQKIYGAPTDAEQRRYSLAKCSGADMKVVSGDPDKVCQHVICRAPEPYDAIEDAALYTANKRLLKEAG